jgi:mannose-6-phosphate isomerase-like protein (cupin superfamily)
MSGYTKLNLKDDVDDMAAGRMPPGIEAHFAKGALEMEKGGVTYYKLGPDFHPPFGHKHEEQEEVYVLISGSATVKVEDEEVALRALDAIRLAPDATRALRSGPDGCELIAFGAPKPDGNDAEMLQGWWPDPDADGDAG